MPRPGFVQFRVFRLEEDKLFYNEEDVSSPKLLKHFFCQEFVNS